MCTCRRSSILVSMRADMHTHSRFSDGSRWPAELAKKAKELGIELLCLTDHDTMGGTREFLETARALGLRSWPGVEIDCVDAPTQYKSELLAYFPQGSYSNTEAFLLQNRKERMKSVKLLCKRVQSLFNDPELCFDKLVAIKTAGHPEGKIIDPIDIRFAKTDIYVILKLRGIISPLTEYREFKKTYFDVGLFADIKFPKPSMKNTISVIRSDNGFPVIPHIGHEFDDDFSIINKEKSRLDSMLKRYYSLGVRGVELYHYRKEKTQAINTVVQETAKANNFFLTYGSDCHGPNSGKETLGQFSGDFEDFPHYSE